MYVQLIFNIYTTFPRRTTTNTEKKTLKRVVKNVVMRIRYPMCVCVWGYRQMKKDYEKPKQ